MDNAYREQSNYKFEDFFWTGSGDGYDTDENTLSVENPTTIYKTKTVFTTVIAGNIHNEVIDLLQI